MKKLVLIVAAIFLSASVFAADLTASFVTSEAAKKDSVEESVSYLKSQISKMTGSRWLCMMMHKNLMHRLLLLQLVMLPECLRRLTSRLFLMQYDVL